MDSRQNIDGGRRMIRCEECSHDPIPNCSTCEELAWLHEFRIKQNQEEEE